MPDPSEFASVGKRGKPIFYKGKPISPKKRLAQLQKIKRAEELAENQEAESEKELLKKLDEA